MLREIRWVLLLVFSLLPNSSMFGADLDSAEKQLAGTQAREWILKRWVPFMGAGKRCKQGESYRFRADHTVTISNCVDGVVHDETEQWSIEGNELDTRLTVGVHHYFLKFWQTSKGHFMMLQDRPHTMRKRTTEMIFERAQE